MKKLLLPILLLLHVVTTAQVPDPIPNTYVNDLAGKLSKAQIFSLNLKLKRLEDSTGVQFAVVLIDKLPPNMTIEDYAREVGRKWHVGINRRGLVYVASIQDRKMRLEVAEMLEGVIPDIEAKRMTDKMKPFFREQNYFHGLDVLIQEVQRNVNVPTPQEEEVAPPVKQEESGNNFGLIILIVALISVPIGFIIMSIVQWRKDEKQEREDLEKQARINELLLEQQRRERRHTITGGAIAKPSEPKPNDGRGVFNRQYIPDPTPDPPKSYKRDDDDSSYRSSSRSSSDDSNSGFGNFGGSGNSGFTGGGSSNDW